ncbi:hypothetical protein Enr13x_10740 [Stieleria neptunia]|uniref:Uncharacterized protein n=1 Tax=Stieleria neptunia TaxID=2527979 RepID=A0A518HK74_9BACT|nr:hypothetical protein [Stieleria neptunia]QDV41236.1 hypothetical protein Enr13x_10740 [Stieleria neptunia]
MSTLHNTVGGSDADSKRKRFLASAGFVCLGWLVGRYQSFHAIEALKAENAAIETAQDGLERHLADTARSGDRMEDYPYAYAVADHRLAAGDEHFLAAYRYAKRDETAIPPDDCEVLWFDFVAAEEPREGMASDCFLIVVDGVICETGHGETLQY